MNNSGMRLLRPVGRRLMAVTMVYLAGVYFSACFSLPIMAAGILCAFFLLAGVFRLRVRRKAVFHFAVVFLLIGNASAGNQLAIRDMATPPYTEISGTVIAIESDYRVRLDDVAVFAGETTNRPVIVTLMTQENAETLPDKPMVGQRVSGTGRLFAQDEVRNPGGTDGRVRALCDGYELSGYILPGRTAQGEGRFSVTEELRQLRERLIAHVQGLFGENSALFLAVMLGERDGLDAEWTAAMRLTGTAHILSVSGMHLSMISIALYELLRRLPVGRRVANAIQVTALFLFAGLTGFAVGTLRALVMTLLQMLARERGRRYDQLTALSLAALLITVCRPLMAFDAGFQFSFFVVLGIILLEKPVSHLPGLCRLKRHARWLYDMLAICLSAQVAAIPMQLVLYGYVPLLSLPMNLLCSILMPFVMIGGWGISALGMLHAGAGMLCAEILSVAARGFESASVFMAGLEGSILRLPAPGRISLVLIGAIMMLISEKIRFGGLRRPVLLMSAALLVVSYLPRLNPAARYVQIDVGQGDASLIRRGRHAVIVDVGPAYSYDMLRYLRHEGLMVDMLFLSHLDEDHAGALSVLLSSEIHISRVVMAEGAEEEVSSLAVMEGVKMLEEQGVAIEHVAAGDVIDTANIHIEVLSPDDTRSGSNERSLLLYAQTENANLLFTGDLPQNCEPENVPDCDILKVAHHGSKYASSASFLEQVSPEVAVISVGAANTYGHPHDRVLSDLVSVGARILRTDQSGCVTIWLDEETLRIDPFLDDALGT